MSEPVQDRPDHSVRLIRLGLGPKGAADLLAANHKDAPTDQTNRYDSGPKVGRQAVPTDIDHAFKEDAKRDQTDQAADHQRPSILPCLGVAMDKAVKDPACTNRERPDKDPHIGPAFIVVGPILIGKEQAGECHHYPKWRKNAPA